MHLHIVALPHTQVSAFSNGCAFTSKVLKFCKMMGSHYRIRVYAPEGPPIPGAELIPCISNKERIETFGPDDKYRLPSWPTDEQTATFNNRVVRAMRAQMGDKRESLICLTGGWTFRAIAEAFPGHMVCEPGVGYLGICTDKCAFESYAWMHTVYAKKKIEDGRWYDTVIPNYFDVDDFPFINGGQGKYLLFLGRLVKRKGPHIASQIAQRAGLPLLVAGAGGKQVGPDVVAPEVIIRNATYVGPVGILERAQLLADAKALIVPTTYIEPFGGVAIEAMLAGTPVISTDWGAFNETVVQGASGFRFRTLEEGARAVENCSAYAPHFVRQWAIDNYSLEAVKSKFDTWFQRLQGLWQNGWYN